MSNQPKAGMNLDPEMLAAYIDNRLTPEQRAEVEAQLARDPDSYAVLVETIKALDEIQVPEVRQVPKVPAIQPWKIAAGVLAVAAALVLVVRVQPDLLQRLRGQRANPQITRLVEAVGEERYLEPRLAGGFRYGTLRSATRSQSGLSNANLSLVAAAGELQKAAIQSPGAATLHAWGTAQVLLGDYAGGIETLSDALRRDPSYPGLGNDLAAALLARNAAGDAAEAYDLVSRISGDDSAAEEAAFNRALALERMGLSRQAAEAWQAFMDRYASSPWRQDALNHLQSSKPQARLQCESAITAERAPALPADCRAQASRAFELVHLKRWADAALAGDSTRTDAALATLQSWADTISQDTADDFTRDVVGALRAERPAAAAAVRQFIDAVVQIDSDRLVGAEKSLTLSLPALRASNNPLAIEAELHLAMVEAQARRLPVAVERLDRIRRDTLNRSYPSITARELWLRGVVALRDLQPALALDHYRAAIALYDQIGFVDSSAAVRNAQADTERLMGLIPQGLGTLQDALTALPRMSQVLRRYLVLFNAALYSELRGLRHASLAFEDEAIVEAQSGDTVMAGIEALTYRARYRAAAHGNKAAAIDDLQRAEQQLPQVQAANLRTYLESRIRLTRFDIDADDGASSDAEVRAAIDFFAGAEPAEVPRLWGTLARSLERKGDADAALGAVESGIATFEESRSRLRDAELQSSALDAAWDLYGQGVDLLMRRGDPARALRLAQRPSELRTSATPIASTVAPHGLSRTGLLVLSEVGPRIYWWFMRAGHRESSGVFPLSTDAMASLVADAARSTRLAPGSVPSAVLITLSDLLVGSLDLSELDRLVVVPDGVLTAFPVAALWSSRTKQFLLEETDLVVGVPSESVAGADHPRRARALIIANSGGETGVEWLRPLPFAMKEASAIAGSYQDSRLLVSDTVTRSQIFDAYRDADIVHFAGHAVANRAVPAMSALLLGGVPARFLYAYELSRLPQSRGKTIVLSACDTGSGRSIAGRGADSLARPFITAGAAVVIATTQAIDDRYAAGFFADFHKRLSQTGDAISALRATQLAAIARQEPLANWSAVTAIAPTAALLEPSTKE